MPQHSPLSTDDLAQRQPVWEALADMFLDTDPSISRHWRAQQLAASPYRLEELEAILVNEVYPVCKYNLMSVAGEWAGFDPDWLAARIRRHLSAPFRWLRTFRLGRPAALVADEWQATKAATVALRNGHTGNPTGTGD